jgi:DNA-binding response OmpR family regulator
MTTVVGRVLVVEDDALVAMFIEDCLLDAGYEVVFANSLRGGLDLAATLEVDAAVLDVNLRGEMSFPIADVLLRRGIPFMICSGYDTSAMARLPHAVPKLTKPMTARQLTAALAATMRLHRR